MVETEQFTSPVLGALLFYLAGETKKGGEPICDEEKPVNVCKKNLK